MLVPQLTERLRDAENESMAKIAELEKQLSQARKELVSKENQGHLLSWDQGPPHGSIFLFLGD